MLGVGCFPSVQDVHPTPLKKRPNCHQYTIYVDESGKTQDNLIFGSMWYLNGAETMKIYQLVENWKKSHRLDEELHFKSITKAKLPHCMELADLISANSAMLSFKVVRRRRRQHARRVRYPFSTASFQLN